VDRCWKGVAAGPDRNKPQPRTTLNQNFADIKRVGPQTSLRISKSQPKQRGRDLGATSCDLTGLRIEGKKTQLAKTSYLGDQSTKKVRGQIDQRDHMRGGASARTGARRNWGEKKLTPAEAWGATAKAAGTAISGKVAIGKKGTEKTQRFDAGTQQNGLYRPSAEEKNGTPERQGVER